MTKPEFAHLHVHSHNSFLDGQGLVDEYLDIISEDNQKALGITDHGNTVALYELITKANDRGITPVPGMEAYLAPISSESPFPKTPVFYGSDDQRKNDVSAKGAYTHQTIWAYNQEGLKNLFKLTSLSYEPEQYYRAARINFDQLADHSEGLVVGSGCPSSEISTRLSLGQDKEAYAYAGRMKEVFGDRFFIEIMDHNMPIDLERKLLPKQIELAKKLGVELLATSDAHYGRKSDAPHHEEMLCAQSGAVMSEKTIDEGGRRFAFSGDEYYLKSAAQMAEIFPEEDFPNALSNTLLIAEMTEGLKIEYDSTLRPQPLIPENETELSYLKKKIIEGFKQRYGDAPQEIKEIAKASIRKELEVISSSDFNGYMLMESELHSWVNEKHSIRHPVTGEILMDATGAGRGSVVGSVIAYCLGIIKVEPIRFDLYFERFLSAGRGATALVEYEDGTSEITVVSEKKTVVSEGEKKDLYVHQLSVGDTVES